MFVSLDVENRRLKILFQKLLLTHSKSGNSFIQAFLIWGYVNTFPLNASKNLCIVFY